MKKFTKLFLSLALLLAGVGEANAEAKTYWEPSSAYGAGWNAGTKTMSWSKNENGWYILYTGFTPAVQNNSTEIDLLDKYTKMHINITSITGGDKLLLKIKSTGKDEKTIELSTGETDVVFANYADVDFSKVLEITLWGTLTGENENGTAEIDECYLLTNNRWEYQKQQQTVYTYALGDALSLSSVVTGNTLVSIASGGQILYGTHQDNQIYRKPIEEAMGIVNARGANESTYRFRIVKATETDLVYPTDITTLYHLRPYKGDGSVLYTGPWSGDGNLNDIGWTYNIAGSDDGCFFAITPVEGKNNTYKISSYKKDGTQRHADIYGESEWTFNVIGETQQQVEVDVLVEVFVPDTEDPGVRAVPDGWVSLIENGKLDGNNVTNFWTKNEDSGAIAAVIDATCGRNGGPGIKVTTKDNANTEWGTQFFVKSSERLKEGQKLHIEFDYRADRPQNAATQVHRAPGDYNANIDAVDFTVNWKHYSNDITITAGMCKQDGNPAAGESYLQSFGLNLSHIKSTSNFYFDNIVMWTEDDPCKAERTALEKAIALGQAQHEDSKTATSFATLTQAIQDGQDVLESTDKTTLTNAAKAITDAISGLKYAAGYAKVTKNMFMTWDGDGADANATGVSPAGADNIGVENAGVPYGYGTGNIYWNHYADLTPYEKLYAIGTKGKRARYVFNRPQDPSNPTGEGTSGFVQKYIDIDENGVAELTLSEVGDFAHLNSFKRPDEGTTFTEFFVYAANTTAKVGEAGYATFSSIMNVDLSDVTGYAAQYDGSKVNLTQITEYPAGAAIIIEAAEGSYSLTNIESADAIANNDLKVSDGSIAGDGSTIFVLADGGNGVGFYLLKSGDKVPAGKAYLKIENSGSSREFIAIDGNATAIKSVETEKANGAIYNMAGQQVKNAQKGIFIMNGKKVIK